MVRGESQLAEDVQDLTSGEDTLRAEEEALSSGDSSDESLSEEEGIIKFCRNADRWRVAFRADLEQGWTDAQWVAYWRERGYFLTPGEPFAIPL